MTLIAIEKWTTLCVCKHEKLFYYAFLFSIFIQCSYHSLIKKIGLIFLTSYRFHYCILFAVFSGHLQAQKLLFSILIFSQFYFFLRVVLSGLSYKINSKNNHLKYLFTRSYSFTFIYFYFSLLRFTCTEPKISLESCVTEGGMYYEYKRKRLEVENGKDMADR